MNPGEFCLKELSSAGKLRVQKAEEKKIKTGKS